MFSVKYLRAKLPVIFLLVILFSVTCLAHNGDSLIIGTTDRVTELSPANSYDHYSWHVLRMCSDSLLKYKPGTNEIASALAKDWEIGADAKVYTFHLREGVTFTDGEPVNASAVKWSLERALRLNGPRGGVGLIKQLIDTIEVIDNLTVKITLTEPNRTFLRRMTGQIAPSLIWSPENTPADEFARGNFAGVGPYKLVDFVPDETVEYEAYDGYYGEKAKINRVSELKYNNSAGLRDAIDSGEIDIAFRTLTTEDIKALKSDPDLEYVNQKSGTAIRYMLFNVTDDKFGDERVRQAVTYAVNREPIVNQVFGGIADPIYSMVPSSFSASKDTFPDTQDIAEAEDLLSQAGYTAENPLNGTLWYTPKHYGSTESDVVQRIKESLNKTDNMNISVQSLDWGTFTWRMSQGELGMFMLGWYPDYLEASNYLEPFIVGSPEGLGTFFNKDENYPEYKDLFDRAMRTTDLSKRVNIYKEIQTKSATDVMFLPLWSNLTQSYVFYKPDLEGITIGPTADIRPWQISRGFTYTIPYVVSHWDTENEELDPDDDPTIDMGEILTAIKWWANEVEVPNTEGEVIDMDNMLNLIKYWAEGTPVE